MNLHEIVSQLIINTKGTAGSGVLPFSPDSSLGVFLPELVLCLTIVVILLVRILPGGRRLDAGWLALIGAGFACCLASLGAPVLPQRMEIFTGMLVYDSFSIYMRTIILLFAVLFVAFTKLSGIPDREDRSDIYTLVLGAILGMCLMVSANHLIMVFMAVEMASVPSYALVGLIKGSRRASEAALKYAVYGAGAAGVMLYGISLIAGLSNSAHLPTIAARLSEQLPAMQGGERMVLIVGGLMIMVGVAFKLSAVPFHFWCPDVFEGATAEIDAFLSVASKAAALGLLVRVTIGLGVLVPAGIQPGHDLQAAQVAGAEDVPSSAGLFAVEDAVDGEGREIHAATAEDGLETMRLFMLRLIALLAVVTCTFGNLAAYGQTNIKRLLAYSTIAHAGYMMMAVPPVLALAGSSPELAEKGISALGLYIAVYVFMNLGAFAIVAFLRNAMHSEELVDYAGLIRYCPGVVICFSIILFGLVGLPPLSGFLGKFAVFAALWQGYQVTGQVALIVLLFAGGINTALSLFYYLRVVKTMAMESDAESRGPVRLPLVSFPGIFIVAVTLPTLVLFVGWNFLYEWTLAAAHQLFG
ncbi:MAG: NADH-quinone oxidoreductase subunit N [Planctomycetes bacterium]|nr:NADH-quinone oxidoreductase subunit N [Planctomycetota bacterium]